MGGQRKGDWILVIQYLVAFHVGVRVETHGRLGARSSMSAASATPTVNTAADVLSRLRSSSRKSPGYVMSCLSILDRRF